MSTIRWSTYDSLVTYFTTELDALAAGALAIGLPIDFSVNRPTYMDIEVYLAAVDLTASVNPTVDIWLLSRTDGVNYEDGSATVTPARDPDATIPLRVVNAAQRVQARFILTNPDAGEILIKNNAGAALAASGNTLKYYTYGAEIV